MKKVFFFNSLRMVFVEALMLLSLQHLEAQNNAIAIDWDNTNLSRVTFTTWHHYTKDSPLLESGLVGTVTIVSAVRQVISEGDKV